MAAADVVFASAASFLAGVFAASAEWSFYPTLLIAFFPAALLLILKKNRMLASLFLFSLVAGFFYYHLALNVRKMNTEIEFDREIGFSGIVASEPKKYEKVQVLELELLPPEKGVIEVMLPRAEAVRYGDLLSLRGVVEAPASEREKPMAFFPEMEIMERGRGFWLREQLFALKENFLSRFNRFLPADSAALLSGLTFGVRSEFSPELKEAMNRSGTTHLVALSGYNVSILVLAVARVFGWWLSRRLTFVLTVTALLLFVLMTGGEASIVRAGLMGFLVLFAKEAGRIYSFRNAVTLAAFGMTIFDPTILVYDIGFQLSFLSLLGIVYLFPALASIFRFSREKAGFLNWKENLLTTASAQLAVLPVLLLYFREFSLTALPANVLILGIVPITMFLGFALAGLGFISYYLGFALSRLVNALLLYEVSVIKLFSEVRLPFGFEAGPAFLIAYYALLLAFILWAKRTNLPP